MIFAILLLPFLSAICYRARGSSWTSNDASLSGLRVAKLAVGAFPLALACWFFGVTIWFLLAVWVLTALADCLPHGEWQGTTNWGQVVMLSLVSVASAIPAAGAILYFHQPLYAGLALLCGFLCGPATWLGNKIDVHFHIGPIGFDLGPEMGEVARGFVRVLFVLVFV